MVMFTKSPLNRMSYKALVLGCFSGLAFLGAGFLISGSVIINNNNASAASDSAETPINIEVNDVISIATGGSIDVSAEPNKFSSASTTLTVSTNSPYGYTMTMAVGGADNTLHHVDATSSSADNTITSLSSNSSASNFPAGKWGYLIGNATNYSPIPAAGSSTTITEAGSTGTETTTVTVGAKPTATNYGGTYTNSLIFTAITNIPPTPTISSITNMQEMTPDICFASAEDESATLTDTRDNNTYNVVKLSTGQCWMQQNLRLGNGSQGYTLNSTNSDLPSGTTFTLPTAQTSGTNSWSSDCTDDISCATNVHLYATGNESYGNYYSWYTATANTGTYSMSSGDATGSICPKGWRLPTGGSSGEIGTLNNTYNSGSTSSGSGLLADPLKLVRSGYYRSGVNGQGTNGIYWSSTVNSGMYAYLLDFNSYVVAPDNSYNKYYGNSVRCLSSS